MSAESDLRTSATEINRPKRGKGGKARQELTGGHGDMASL